MPIRIAPVHDLQSAEYVKALALQEPDRDRALKLWREAHRLWPQSTPIAGHLAMSLLDHERPREVVDLLLPHLEDNPRHVHFVNVLGVALFDLGHAKQSIRLFELTRRIDPEYPSAQNSIQNATRMLAQDKPVSAALEARLDALLAAAAEAPRPTLAVCLIVKNEEDFLGGAIDSVQGLADQVVVVDTGSTDRTVELAREKGAQVEFFAWTGDFSEARNACHPYVRCDWILALDADERVSAGSRTALRAIMEEGGDLHRVVVPKIRNYTRDGRFMSDGFSGRLYRNLPEMYWSGRVHEEVGVHLVDISLDYRLDLVLDHYGADPEVIKEKAKDERNIELLEKRLEERPDDLMTYFYLASQHWIAHRFEEATEAFERVVELFERNPSGYGMAVRTMPVPYSYVGLARAYRHFGRLDEAIELGERALGRWPDNGDLWYHTGFAYIDKGDFDTARNYLDQARTVRQSGYDLIAMHDASIETWRATKVLGDIDYELSTRGDEEDLTPEAVRAYRQAAWSQYDLVHDKIPDHAEELVTVLARRVELAAGLGMVEALPDCVRAYLARRPDRTEVLVDVSRFLAGGGDLQGAYDLLTGLYEAHETVQADPEVSLLVGAIAEQAGEDREAVRWYERVVALGYQEAGFYANLARVFLRLQQPQAAAEALQIAKQLAGE